MVDRLVSMIQHTMRFRLHKLLAMNGLGSRSAKMTLCLCFEIFSGNQHGSTVSSNPPSLAAAYIIIIIVVAIINININIINIIIDMRRFICVLCVQPALFG